MPKVRLEEPIKIGYGYSLKLTWPTAFLGSDNVAAELRATPSTALLANFAVSKTTVGDKIETVLSLTKTQTAALKPGDAQTEPKIIAGTDELPVNLLLQFKIREHTTKAAV